MQPQKVITIRSVCIAQYRILVHKIQLVVYYQCCVLIS